MSQLAAERFKRACVSVLGAGGLRPAPGTWGSAAAIIPFLVCWFAIAPLGQRLGLEAVLIAGILTASAISVLFGPWAVEYYGRADPKNFVLDEFAGQWVALLLLPMGLGVSVWAGFWVVGGQFILFRVFDIIKPPPARQFERLPHGWGILVDDLFAGLYANLAGQVAWRLTPLAGLLNLTLYPS